MRRHRSNKIGVAARIALGIVFTVGVGGAMQALTASNTVTADKAGDGSSTITGYTISAVAYALNATDPQNIDTLTFTTSALANTVKARLVATGSWYPCTTTNGPTNTTWTCATTSPQVTVSAADELRVVATE